jgi:hypothetical protein
MVPHRVVRGVVDRCMNAQLGAGSHQTALEKLAMSLTPERIASPQPNRSPVY